jgi:uncharacterized protein
MKSVPALVFATVLAAVCTLPLKCQSTAFPVQDVQTLYRSFLRAFDDIGIFDNHGHPGFADDPDVDAMASPPGSQALRTRADNPELVAASRALFAYPYNDLSPQHAKWLADRKLRLRKELGNRYFTNILDRLHVQTAIANRVAMPEYLDRKRFLWASFADSFLFPFNNERIRTQNIDEQTYIPLQEKQLRRELRTAGLDAPPATFDDYLKFVTRAVEADKRAGSIALKFEAAYFRSLSFSDPTRDQAAAVFKRFRSGGAPSEQEYAPFQDYVFRYLLMEAARLQLAAHFHTSVGIGDFFSLHRGNVLNLENILRDPRYEQVRFVLLHGGFPYDREAIWLASRKNVFLDSSLVDLYLYPSAFKLVLKYWLSIYPEKVLFGSDAFPFNETLGAEEAYWLSIRSSREALAGALAELVAEGAFSRSRAMQIARGYLHDNAAKLYRF